MTLTEGQRTEAVSMVLAGETQRSVAAQFGVTPQAITKLMRRNGAVTQGDHQLLDRILGGRLDRQLDAIEQACAQRRQILADREGT